MKNIVFISTIAMLLIPTGMTKAMQTGAVTSVSAASYRSDIAIDSIVAAFGQKLATTVEGAVGLPLPTSIAGTTVKVTDSTNTTRLAQLFFVSPSQINYLVPLGTVAGESTITVENGAGDISTGRVNIYNFQPGLFTANADGSGVPAFLVLRIKPDGTQTYEKGMEQLPSGRFVPYPIKLGPEGDRVVLVLFGTGIRHYGSSLGIGAYIGGVSAEILYAGPQGAFVGLDQVNVLLPRSVVGRGEVSLYFVSLVQPLLINIA